MSYRDAAHILLAGSVALATGIAAAVPARSQVAQPSHDRVRKAEVSPTAAPAAGQSAIPSGPDAAAKAGPIEVKLKPNPSLPGWTKICDKDQAGSETCYTTLDYVSDENKPVLAAALYETRSGPQMGAKVARFMLPTALLLQQGMRFAVDGKEWVPGRYRICMPNGCVAEAAVKDEVSFTKGTSLLVSVLNGEGREIVFSLPLAGFAKAYDGPPITAEALRKQQEAFLKDAETRQRAAAATPAKGADAPSGDAATKR